MCRRSSDITGRVRHSLPSPVRTPVLYQRNGRCGRTFISGPLRNRRRYYGYWHTWWTTKHRVNGDYPCKTTRNSSAGPDGKPINDQPDDPQSEIISTYFSAPPSGGKPSWNSNRQKTRNVQDVMRSTAHATARKPAYPQPPLTEEFRRSKHYHNP